MGWFSKVVDAVKSAAGALAGTATDAAETVGDAVGDAANAVGDTATGAAGAIRDLGSDAILSAGDAAAKAYDTVTDMGYELLDPGSSIRNAGEIGSRIVEATGDVTSKVIGETLGASILPDAIEDVGDKLADAVGEASNLSGDAIEKVAGTAGSAADAVTDKTTDGVLFVGNEGWDITKGAGSFVGHAVGDAAKAVGDAVEGAVQTTGELGNVAGAVVDAPGGTEQAVADTTANVADGSISRSFADELTTETEGETVRPGAGTRPASTSSPHAPNQARDQRPSAEAAAEAQAEQLNQEPVEHDDEDDDLRRPDAQPGEVETIRKETDERATLDAEIGNRTNLRMENQAASEEPAADDSQALYDAKQRLREQSIDLSGERLSDTADTAADEAEVRPQRDEPGVERDEPSVGADTQYTAQTMQAQPGQPIHRVADMASNLDDLDDTALRKAEPEAQRATLGETAAAADIGDGITGQPGIEEPIAEVAELPDVGTGDDLGIDDATGLAPPDAGEARDGTALLGGLLTGNPAKSDADLEFSGGADPRLSETSPGNMTEDGNDQWSGSQSWTDILTSKGKTNQHGVWVSSESQSITGKEHYETERYTLDVETTHEDGVTRQRITQTDKETGEVTEEETTDGPPDEDTSGGDDTAGGVAPVSGHDSTPNPADGDDGGIGSQTEVFRGFTDSQRVASTPGILGAGSLQQHEADGEWSSIPDERPPREVSQELLKQQLNPYIQYGDDHVEAPQLAPEDLVFDNTLVDPDLDPIGGLSGLKSFPGETGPDPEADAIDELDLDG